VIGYLNDSKYLLVASEGSNSLPDTKVRKLKEKKSNMQNKALKGFKENRNSVPDRTHSIT
jgi:hypothetical protein